MKAMIFAAGLGTRLKPLTNTKPKALVEVGGMPLLEIIISRLKKAGISEFVVNVHHFAGLIEQFLEANNNFGCNIAISDERDLLLDTGGGLQKARALLGDAPFLVHNVDILTDLDLHALRQAHLQSGSVATLAVRDRSSSRVLLFDENMLLSGWRNNRTGEKRICRKLDSYTPLAFSGVYMISPRLFEFMEGEREVFSIIDTFLEAGGKVDIRGFTHNDGYWLDVGKLPALEEAKKIL